MISAYTLKRLLIEALADGDDYDGFRTRLRVLLKEADGATMAPQTLYCADAGRRAAERALVDAGYPARRRFSS